MHVHTKQATLPAGTAEGNISWKTTVRRSEMTRTQCLQLLQPPLEVGVYVFSWIFSLGTLFK